ncbi:hypothetical protein SOVF_127610 [Spinacia oleracea]|uniref:Uncharacterized protein isoform X1 n=1 Tax=Spinacia oleracea TaxID=3562 RepID=A0ABM3QLL6_SPIOL|nr:uncharacterized protein LOC110777958 isoform X1 [Spinacia oleracea]XP_056684256.1 uncharacterized protein LOC110777958 isoform X1 [Spinacia oleracea]KNA12258.1 hypothetical protein SOVF_127610 [Spinacia oleracea]
MVQNAVMPKAKVHINFVAKSDDDDSFQLFFSEMYVPWNKGLETDKQGCCILELVDSGNPNSSMCQLCWYPGCTLMHPTPGYGFRSASGDPFTDLESRFPPQVTLFSSSPGRMKKSPFFEGIPLGDFKYPSLLPMPLLPDPRIELIPDAKKVLEQYNSNKHSNFKFKEVTAVKTTHPWQYAIHMNFVMNSRVTS